MNHFHNAKIVATMGPSIDKETILSKIVNNIDVFRINLSHGDEETKKKYINMVFKLDSSKSVMLDTKGPEIRTRNKDEMTLKKNQKVQLAYAEFFKEEEGVLYIDYPNMQHIKEGTIVSIDSDSVRLEVVKQGDEYLECKVIHGGTVLINRSVDFDNYIPKLAFLSEKDKSEIKWGVDNKINMISVSYIRDEENIQTIRSFLEDIEGSHIKVISKIETKEAIKNIESIIQASDGIIINRTKLEILVGKKSIKKKKQEIIHLCNKYGKPVIISTGIDISKKRTKSTWKTITEELKMGVDSLMLTKETAVAEEPIEFVVELYELINESDIKVESDFTLDEINIHEENPITDYIIYNAYRAAKEIEIKAIICPTESGYTPARLSSLKPSVPIISFTKNDDAYRYLNLLWGVKGYKISSTFEYENIKQIGKEIIRILFKGNISLDDRILIVHSSIEQNIPQMINGFELYKFKDI